MNRNPIPFNQPLKLLTLLSVANVLLVTTAGCGSAINQQAAKTFMSKLGNTSITVFPTFVRHGEVNSYDTQSADRIAAWLIDRDIATTARSEAEVSIASQWGSNQSTMFQESTADLASYVAANPIETDYAFLAEYLLSSEGNVMGIHAYLVDADGLVAYGTGLNSHHDEFTSVDPQNESDCTTALLEALRRDLVDTQ